MGVDVIPGVSIPGSFASAPGQSGILGKLVGANMNVTTDQAIAISAAKYRITRITVTNASASLTLAAGGVYPAAAKGGTAIVAAGQLYTALTVALLALDLTLAVASTVYSAVPSIFFSLTTAQGAAATADIYIYGDVLA